MAAADLDNPAFQDDDLAREWFERRLWPDGPVCPHCGSYGEGGVTRLHGAGGAKGTKHRPGCFQCNQCRSQFTVTVGTVMERSKIGLHIWLKAMYLLSASKKGISTHQLHRMLGVSLKSTWFMMHRIREAMREGKLPRGMGGEGKFVEADETFVGGKAKNRAYAKTLPPHEAVMSLVERGGKVRSRHVPDVTAKTLKPILVEEIAKETNLRTDQSPVYTEIGTGFASHATVNHSIKEYVRGDAYTNTVEGYFSIFKRGIYGVYQHVSAEHLKRYLAEFDFRYNYRVGLGFTDMQRTEHMARGVAGKRLTYQRTRQQPEAEASA